MIVFSIAKGFHKLTRNIPPELSPKELDRLRAIKSILKLRTYPWFVRHLESAGLLCIDGSNDMNPKTSGL